MYLTLSSLGDRSVIYTYPAKINLPSSASYRLGISEYNIFDCAMTNYLINTDIEYSRTEYSFVIGVPIADTKPMLAAIMRRVWQQSRPKIIEPYSYEAKY